MTGAITARAHTSSAPAGVFLEVRSVQPFIGG
jgi:hypothetical protein